MAFLRVRERAGGGVEVSDDHVAERAADELGDQERRNGTGGNTGEAVGKHPGNGYGRVGEAGRAGEPVGGRDVGADGVGDAVTSAAAGGAENDEHQPGGGDHLGQPDAGTAAVLRGHADGR
jgi:hypothetical protein